MRSLVIPLALTLLGCSSPASEAPRPAPVMPAPVAPAPVTQSTPREGITVERIHGPVPLGMGDGLITLVRFDMSYFRPRLLLAASSDGRARTLPEWAAQEHLVGGINLAMYEPDGRPTSFVVEGGVERSPDDERFGGVLAFGPWSEEAERPFAMSGRDCEGGGLAALRTRYQHIVTNYRMLDCHGRPIAWVDEHRYSSAAIGVDRQGGLVFIHVATPYLMRDLARVLAEPSLGLVQVHYVEGGPEATLFFDDGLTQTTLIGYPRDAAERRPEQAPYPPEQVGRAWPLPNVLGVVAR